MRKPELSQPLQEYLGQLHIDADRILESYSKSLPDAFRVNTLKTNDQAAISALEGRGYVLRKISWTRHGYIVEQSNGGRLSDSPEVKYSLVYIQGPVSMAIPEILEPVRGNSVLDMCAAPGSKSTQILQMLGGEGELVANEPSQRARALSENLKASGATNYIIETMDGRSLHRKYDGKFDRVLVDAPCSGLGVASKDWAIARDWKHIRSRRLATLQTGLIYSGYRCLKPGGIMVYSTCTFTAEENELVVNKLLKKTGTEIVEAKLPGLNAHSGLTSWKGKELSPELAKCLRIYPYDNDAEGFFIAKIRKPDKKE